ncbi:MAG: hypothetical protein M1822_004989 [Bathelium mastoideum]|nr:MAG: hypothetical protein M1822_004989 [Bathelium mastoideum]
MPPILRLLSLVVLLLLIVPVYANPTNAPDLSFISQNDMGDSLMPSLCGFCGGYALGFCQHCSQRQLLQSRPQRAFLQHTVPDPRIFGAPAQVEHPTQSQYSYHGQTPPSVRQSFVPSPPNHWPLTEESHVPFQWQTSTTCDGGQPLSNENQTMYDNFSTHLPFFPPNYPSNSHHRRNDASRPGFEHTHSIAHASHLQRQAKPPLDSSAIDVYSIPIHTLHNNPIHAQRTNSRSQSYQGQGTDVALPLVSLASIPQHSEDPIQHGYQAPMSHRPRAAGQNLMPAPFSGYNNTTEYNPIDQYLSNKEEYKPGLSPSRVGTEPAQPSPEAERNDSPTDNEEHRCPHCPKSYKTKNALKYVQTVLIHYYTRFYIHYLKQGRTRS